MKLHALTVTALALVTFASCTPTIPSGRRLDPTQVTALPRAWPTPAALAPTAAPRIQVLWMNETTIPTGSDWYGRIVASTNTASIEIRTESFSFVADRTTFGNFSFREHVLDMIEPYRSGYTLVVIARNAAGVEDRVTVPIAFK